MSGFYMSSSVPVIMLVLAILYCDGKLIKSLIFLEFCMLYSVLIMTHFFDWEGSTALYLGFFTIAVCEATVGLSILVKLIRDKGSGRLSPAM